MGKIKNFKELVIWQKAIELTKEIYRVTESFPNKELYGLSSQMRRCAVSVPSNVAEGFRRLHSKELKQFLSVALGSLAELETQIIIATEMNYLSSASVLCETIDHISRMIVTLSKRIY